MIKFTRSTKKKLDKVRHNSSSTPPTHNSSSSHHHHHHASHSQQHRGGGGADRSVSSAYSTHSQYSNNNSNNNNDNNTAGSRSGGGRHGTTGGGGGGRVRHHSRGGASVASSTGGSRRYSSAQSVASISSASVFAPSVVSGAASTGGGGGGLQPSSARLLRDLNASARSSLLSSLGTAASRTFRSYKMSLPRCPPPVKSWNGSASGSGSAMGGSAGGLGGSGEEEIIHPPVETDLELLGRTVHAVSSALTEPPREGDKYMIYDVSFNPKGCVWDALIVVQVKDDDDADGVSENDHSRSDRSNSHNRRGSAGKGGQGSSARMRSRSRSTSRSSRNLAAGGGVGGEGGKAKTFTFPIRVTCAEDDDVEDPPPASNRESNTPQPPRAKTYAVDLSVIDDSIHHPISRWSTAEAAEHRDDIKNAMEWVSYGIRRSMARSMFPQFPEGCQGKQFREVYQLNKKLKSGTFSTVCRGVHRATGRQVAVKCILRKKIEPSVDAAVFEEVLIMSGLHHRYICPMIDYFEEDRCHFVVMELEKGGDLCERLNDKQTYSEQDARTVVRNVCEAMEFVHSKGFAHCDIKPRNYLLRSKRDDVDVRLADFGFAQHVHAPNSLTSQCGTPFFVAPEVINRKPYDQKVDMWSIGITCYLLLCGDTPFNGKNRQQLFRRISCDEPTFPDDKWGHVSDEAVEFVRKLLTKEPAKRLSAAQALQHRWLMEGNSILAQQQQQVHASHAVSGGESTEDILDRKRGSSRGPGGRKSPSKAAASPIHHDVQPASPRTTSLSRERNMQPTSQRTASLSRERNMQPTSPRTTSVSRERRSHRSVNRSISRDRVNTDRSVSRSSVSRNSRVINRSVSRDRVNNNRSVSRESNQSNRGAPPPPPKPQAPPRDNVVKQSMNSSGTAVDDNARLLDVIKNQDAKIEKLERMVKRMLEPEGAVHEC